MENNTTFDNICGSILWDTNLTWTTNDPDLTYCFQNSILIWSPCLLLWSFTFLETYYLMNSKRKNIPWTWHLILKFILTIGLVLLSCVDLFVAIHNSYDTIIYPVEYYTPIIKILTFILAGVILFYNKKFGMRTSGLLFLFWLSLTICGVVRFRSILLNSDDKYRKSYSYVSYMIYYPLVVMMFLLQFIVEAPPKYSKYPEVERPCPEQAASFPSRLLFAWFDKMAWTGFKKPLEPTDLWSMNPEDTAAEIIPKFDKHWNKRVQKCEKLLWNYCSTSAKASFEKSTGHVDLNNQRNKKKVASITIPLCKAFGGTFIFGAILKLTQDIMIFISPQILNALIGFVNAPDEPMWKGYFYAGLLFLTASLQTIVLSQYFNRMSIVGLRIRTALTAAIYRKALRMSNTARKESTVGEIVNLMSVDAQRFMELTAYINMIWSAPLQIALALYFLWDILGPSVLAGLAVMIILIPVNAFIASKSKSLQMKQMKNKDERVKLMNEVLNGIKVLKLYAWEPSFEQQILNIRNKEIKVLKEAAYLNAGTSFIWSCAPFLVSLVSFATYVYVDETHVLDSQKTFVSLSLFNILRFPLSMLPMMITNVVQAAVSVKRINVFMNNEELDPTNVQHDKNIINPLIIENGTFLWESQTNDDNDDNNTLSTPTLRNINLSIKNGQLVAIVGTVGSGKSSLISAFLGEMDKLNGRVNTYGSIAYVSQQAWIQNATMQDNILFGKQLDKQLYSKVVESCALGLDLKMLPAGDQTEIGEKGINLSGGQKQRVSLARAVYNDSDIYFLDDPLSAVDSHVGKHIFESVIGPNGLLKKKTRLFVTHGITYLPDVDNIVVLKDGQITETGTYKQLLEKRGAFADFLIHHLTEVQTEDSGETDLDEIKQHLESTIGSEELQQKLTRALSRISVSKSESGSVGDQKSITGSLKRQASTDSHQSTGLLRSGSIKDNNNTTNIGRNLIDVEKTETGSVKLKVYTHYLKSIGWFLSICTIAMNAVFQGFSIGANIWMTKWSDDKDIVDINGTVDAGKRDMYVSVYGLLGLGQGLTAFIISIILALGAIRASVGIFEELLIHVLRIPASFFDTTPSGRILNRFGKDTDVVDNTLPMVLRMWSNCFFSVIATLVVISYSTPAFSLLILPIGIIYYFIQRFYVATSRQLKRLESVSRSPIYSHFSESVTGAQTIRAYGEQQRFIKESENRVDFNQVCFYPSIIANRWLAVRLEMIGNLIIFFAGLFAVLGRNTMSPGLVGLSVSYALQITQTLNWLVRMTSDVETNIVAVERIKEYGETPQEAPWEIKNTTPQKNWPQNGCVVFDNFKVRYREGLELVLKGVTFKINGGEKVGIVGRTGAGKSSLTLALFRIIEAADGKILIDDIDISKLGLHSLRSRLTIIPQDPVLFSGSLRMNLDPFTLHSDDDLWKALENAHLKLFVKSLQNGLQHEITEGGDNLSVGQRQLVCLARALLRKTKILILDEATAAVDLETDDLIQRTIREEFQDCTVLTIAHRLNTIIDSNRVIVLDKGYVTEFDSPNNLLQNPTSAFYSMAKDAGLVA
ncbi:multidrug resistance-associated protein 1 isoform X9 [Aphidius gifuensis]|uniref:multidrug resistance-associated protein 1 isoform X9 n=1 Tax=Aphidius gifuensis TaxID=684658 RepID=UPI001CDC04CD|nr:multidrug resistance-associated protein 1 isoform X9 [Aphidius gifuensis]XP_044001773.1 multidrug resistance-associated protein 1 isoform X9 [Aphidius gifuensis]XP_044001776.1 multidrug resistance-associated protein 1 isoform X9 [Aphidius gifuensis]XP_044001777.1 multidrug resistance-associated protein 1 isoform X9 [Aphidius gifuensis]XP_044001778.1 multidrug resistance-associated protein 1 isoform X9 [Aphidius gifuensis]XP_044001779.1 multidrug resistance-associated protein 1 isoform X9 [A